MGLPFGTFQGISQSTFLYLHTGLRKPIENGYHALAIDEHRKAFLPTLWTAKNPQARTIESVEQRWFVGAHANVGGGCRSDVLAQPPLRWIMEKVSQHGLTFRTNVDLDGDIYKAPISDSHAEFAKGYYKRFSSPRDRPVGSDAAYTDGTADYVVNETIDSSVFGRWKYDINYRPKSLTVWSRKHGVIMEQVNGSVRADNPGFIVDNKHMI